MEKAIQWLSPEDIDAIVRQRLKDATLLWEAVGFSIFTNTLAYYLIEEKSEMYGEIIEDAGKRCRIPRC